MSLPPKQRVLSPGWWTAGGEDPGTLGSESVVTKAEGVQSGVTGEGVREGRHPLPTDVVAIQAEGPEPRVVGEAGGEGPGTLGSESVVGHAEEHNRSVQL
jgi:hypothetical protein